MHHRAFPTWGLVFVLCALALACGAPDTQSGPHDGTGEFQLLPGEVSLWSDS